MLASNWSAGVKSDGCSASVEAPDACELLPGATTPEITKLIRDALDEGYVQALAEEKA
jgi:hypothetical protein